MLAQLVQELSAPRGPPANASCGALDDRGLQTESLATAMRDVRAWLCARGALPPPVDGLGADSFGAYYGGGCVVGKGPSY